MAIVAANTVVLREPELFHVATLDGNVPKGLTGSVSAGSGAGFSRYKGVVNFSESVPNTEIQVVNGDGGQLTQYRRASTTPVTIDGMYATYDADIIAKLTATTLYLEGQWEIAMRSQTCQSFNNMALIISGRAISQTAGTIDQTGWYTIFIFRATGEQLGLAQAFGSPTQVPINWSVNKTDTTWWEEVIDTNYDKVYSWGTAPIIADYPLMGHYYRGNNAATTVTLDYVPSAASSNAVAYWKDGVKKAYTTDYTLVTSTRVVTFAAAPASDTDNLFIYEYVAPC